MAKVLPSKDILPLSEFRSHTAEFVKRIHETRRPVFLTQHGRSAAVLMDVGEYEKLLERIELLQDIQTSEKQFSKGEGVSHAKARVSIPGRLRK